MLGGTPNDSFPVRDEDSDIIDNAQLQESQVNSPSSERRSPFQDEQDCTSFCVYV